MAYRSFRSFLDALEKAGELKRVAIPVDTDLLIAEWADREMKSPGGGKALLFEQPIIDGKKSNFPSRSTRWDRAAAWRCVTGRRHRRRRPGNSTHPESKTADRSARRLESAQARNSSPARAPEIRAGSTMPGSRASLGSKNWTTSFPWPICRF